MEITQDELICVCAEVYQSTIEKAIRENGADTAEEIGQLTGAGTHCGGCIDRIRELIQTTKEK